MKKKKKEKKNLRNRSITPRFNIGFIIIDSQLPVFAASNYQEQEQKSQLSIINQV